MTRLSTGPVIAAFILATQIGAAPAWAATVVAQQGDASMSHDATAGTWTLAAGGATLTLALDPSRDFSIEIGRAHV